MLKYQIRAENYSDIDTVMANVIEYYIVDSNFENSVFTFEVEEKYKKHIDSFVEVYPTLKEYNSLVSKIVLTGQSFGIAMISILGYVYTPCYATYSVDENSIILSICKRVGDFDSYMNIDTTLEALKIILANLKVICSIHGL